MRNLDDDLHNNNQQQQDLFEEVLQMYGSSTECEDLVLDFTSSDTNGLMKRVESYLSSGSSWYKKLKVDKDMESLDSFGINEVSDELDDEKSDCSFTNRYEESLNWEVDNYEDTFDDYQNVARKEKPCCKKFSPLIRRTNINLEFLDPSQCIEASCIGCSSLERKTLIVSTLFIACESSSDHSSTSSSDSHLNSSSSLSCNVSYSAMDSSNRVLLVHSKVDINKETEKQRLIRSEILKISSSLTDAFRASSTGSLLRIPDIRVLFCRSDLVLDQGLANRVEFLNFGENTDWNEWIDETSPIIKQIIEGSLRELDTEHSLRLFSMVSNYVHDYFGNFNSIYNLISSFTNFDCCNTDFIIAQTAITTAKIMTKVKELATKKEIEYKDTISKIETESRTIIRKKNKEIEKLKKQLNEFKKNFYSTVDLTEKAEKKQETKIIDLSSHLIVNSKHDSMNRNDQCGPKSILLLPPLRLCYRQV
ncbi:predicted protein [Naegleria gruberi]|uniref:Predicted protein n=1 Tax=Naegleria gruberi TaxID=5762 RepID=D2UZ69_NAEGR|nr:uncharacterized protein NAEGRDRAFT_45406 [Naegleria gruberi]EFC49892.1 predicted protein [Naegleria gruberi]|eukprot:XP_002682636.1 predicted protein [Naegleria gruberi strain NEG-M]